MGSNLTYSRVVGAGVGLALRFRHWAWLIVGVVYLLTSRPLVSSLLWATAGLVAWSTLRLYTGSRERRWEAADLAVAVAYTALPVAAVAAAKDVGGSMPIKVATAAILSFGVSLSWRWSLGVATMMLVAVFAGFRNVEHLDLVSFLRTFAVGYLLAVWVLAVAARQMVLRAASDVDTSLAALAEAQVLASTSAARRRRENEERAILHDTAVATLMLVGEGTPIEPDRLAVQARRDLELLEAGIPIFDADADEVVDLIPMLAEVSRGCSTPVSLRGDRESLVRSEVAWVVTASVREALTNVDRHAHAEAVVVQVDREVVAVTDDGIGFSAAVERRGRHGIQGSLIDRMSWVGGTAAVTAAADGGTQVVLSWQDRAGPAPESDEGVPAEVTTGVDRLDTGLGFAIAAIAIVDTMVQSTRGLAVLEPPLVWVHLLLAVINVACAVTAVVAVRRRRSTTVALMVASVVASVLLTAVLPASQVLGGANWSVGAVGWTVVALGLRSPRMVTVATLLTWWALAGTLIIVKAPTREIVQLFGFQTASILFTQMFTALFAAGLYRVVRAVADLDRERRDVLAAAAVNQELRFHCERRYRKQLRSLLPVLRVLAGSPAAAGSDQVQTAARKEHARLRRLLDRADHLDHPVFAGTAAAVEAAEDRGVAVTVESAQDLPPISDSACSEVVAALAIVLIASRSRVRITATTRSGQVVISAVGDPALDDRAVAELSDSTTTVVAELLVDEESGSVWLQLRCAHIETLKGPGSDQRRRDRRPSLGFRRRPSMVRNR